MYVNHNLNKMVFLKKQFTVHLLGRGGGGGEVSHCYLVCSCSKLKPASWLGSPLPSPPAGVPWCLLWASGVPPVGGRGQERGWVGNLLVALLSALNIQVLLKTWVKKKKNKNKNKINKPKKTPLLKKFENHYLRSFWSRPFISSYCSVCSELS